ncbi:sensor histidine kinase [Sinosporangium siamense]
MRGTGRSLTRKEILIAAGCAVADTGAVLVEGPPPVVGPRLWLALGLLVLIDAALAAPARLSGVVAVAQGTVYLFGVHLFVDGAGDARQVSSAGLLIAGYRAGAWLSTVPALVSLAALAVGSAGRSVVAGRDLPPSHLIIIALTCALLPWMVGRYTTARRAYISELERRRRDQEAAVQRAVAEERSAIARDLHDVISHHVSAVGVHAGAARLGLGASTPGVAGSLTAVEESSRAAMADLRRMLDLLHGHEEGGAVRHPGLGDLAELARGVSVPGRPVELTVRGEPSPVPVFLDMALYRIAQEALTNAMRHGDGGEIRLEVDHRCGEVVLTVTNGVGSASPRPERRASPPRGLTGVRQRVALFGGWITCGPHPEGRGWRLQVGLPLAGRPGAFD